MNRILYVFATLALLLTGVVPESRAADDGATEKRVAAQLAAYTLDMDKVRHWCAASYAMNLANEADPAHADYVRETPSDDVVSMTARYRTHPKLMSYYTKEGLGAKDVAYLNGLLVPTLLQMADPVNIRSNVPLTPKQKAFIDANRDELARITPFKPRPKS